MNTIIIDASMACNWQLDDEKNEAANQILEEARACRMLVPSIFWHEMRNIFISSEKRGRTTKAEILQLLEELRALGIREQESSSDALILSLAFQHNLSAYDAAYLALAIQTNAILATNDRQLACAAKTANVALRTVLDRSQITQ